MPLSPRRGPRLENSLSAPDLVTLATARALSATPGELTADAYRPALFVMVGLLAVGLVANLLVRPVAERFHEPDPDRDADRDVERSAR